MGALVGYFVIISFAKYMGNQIIQWFGRNSLILMEIQIPLIKLTYQFLDNYIFIENIVRFLIVIIISCVIIMVWSGCKSQYVIRKNMINFK